MLHASLINRLSYSKDAKKTHPKSDYNILINPLYCPPFHFILRLFTLLSAFLLYCPLFTLLSAFWRKKTAKNVVQAVLAV
jgi:hypothetical protein